MDCPRGLPTFFQYVWCRHLGCRGGTSGAGPGCRAGTPGAGPGCRAGTPGAGLGCRPGTSRVPGRGTRGAAAAPRVRPFCESPPSGRRTHFSTLDGAKAQVADFSRFGAHICPRGHFSRFGPKSRTF